GLELQGLLDVVEEDGHLRYPNPVHDSTPTRSPFWLRYSTSISQKRPVPSFVVFSSLTDRSTCLVERTSPGRTGSKNVSELSLITASGRSNRSFMSKCTCSGRACSVRPGAQWWGRNHVESIVGGAMGPPVSSPATLSSQNRGLPFSTEEHAVQT